MKLKKTDTNKKIRVKNVNKASYIITGGEYTINRINDDGSMVLSNVQYSWYGNEGVHFEFLEYPNEDMEIGDTVVVVEKTTTLKEGEEKKIIAFLCDDRNKIILEGIIPGGWIEPRKLTKKIDISKLRIKKAVELFAQKGPTFFTDMYLSQSVKEILGKNLEDLQIKQIGKKLVTRNGGGITLSQDLYTDSKYEDLEIVISNKLAAIGYCRTGCKSDKLTIVGKKLSELRKNFNSQKEDDVVKLSCEISNGGHIKHGDFALLLESFEIIKSSQNEEQKPVTVGDPL